MTVRVQGNDWEELWVETHSEEPGMPPLRRNAYPFGDDSFAVGVPVWEGVCALKVQGRRAGEQSSATLVRVVHPAESIASVRLSVTPSEVYTPSSTVQIEAAIEGLGAPDKAWLDADGDGRLDAEVSPTGAFSWTYPGEGYFLPGLVVRANGIYYDSSEGSHAVKVAASPSLAETPGQFELSTPARDVAEDRIHGQVLVLTEDSRLQVFDGNGALIASHSLQAVQDVVAIDVDQNGDVFAIDRALHQLRKFSRSNSYLPDTSFGNAGVVGGLGTADAEFNEPMDVQCLRGIDGVHVWVADSGNQRLQRFLGSGQFQLQVPTGVDIGRPVTMVADFAGHVSVLDGIDGDLAVFEFDGTRVAYRPHVVAVDPAEPARACIYSDLRVMVADPAARRLLCYDRDGKIRLSVDTTPDAPLALARTAEERLLVVVAGGARLQRLESPEPAGGSPVEVVTRFFAAIHQSIDSTALGLVAPETALSLGALLTDPVTGPEYRDLAGRLGGVSELSRSRQLAAVHAIVDAGTPDAKPVVIELRRDFGSNRWLVVGL